MKQSGIFYSDKDFDRDMELFKKNKRDEGSVTKKTMLRGIIPDGWREVVYELDEFWAIHVERNEPIHDMNIEIRKEEFRDFIYELKTTLGVENIEKIDTLDKAGSYFIVYLKKQKTESWTDENQKDLEEFYKKYNI